jgi:hypothetical protein
MDNAQYIAYGESVDGLYWPAMQVILGKNPETPVYAYANAVGLGADPGILGETFYSYYTEWPTGESWNPAAIKRLTITTAATLTRIVPSNTAIGGSAFTPDSKRRSLCENLHGDLERLTACNDVRQRNSANRADFILRYRQPGRGKCRGVEPTPVRRLLPDETIRDATAFEI